MDSLDLGVYVDWQHNWQFLEDAFLQGKKEAETTEGIPFRRDGISGLYIMPRGAGVMYAFHLFTASYHFFIARRKDSGSYPNVLVRISSRSLWVNGVTPSITTAGKILETLGGCIVRVQISRCDLCSDFLVPGGLSLDFLEALGVSRSRKRNQHLDNQKLETYYVGARGAPVQLRIYDKSKEIAQNPDKSYFFDVWRLHPPADVWRIEYQIRRLALKEFDVNSIEDLASRAGGLWRNLTESWFSLRIKDDSNTTRREFHPFWLAVQDSGDHFGDALDIKRKRVSTTPVPVESFVARSIGSLIAWSARKGKHDAMNALEDFADQMRELVKLIDWEKRYDLARVNAGLEPGGDGAPW